MKREERERTEATEAKPAVNRTFKMATALSLVLFVTLALVTFAVVTASMMVDGSRSAGDGADEGALHNPLIGTAIASVVLGGALGTWQSRRIIAPVTEIGEAAKRVARGDFDVELHRSSSVREVRDMADNFTAMTRELAQTELLRSDFVSNVSHEFKTPLAAIEGYATLLESPTLSDERRAQCVAKIASNARRLSSLTDNVLRLSKLEREAALGDTQAFSLDEQIRACVLLLEDAWSERGIAVDVELEDVRLRGDEDLLAHVWTNLLGNAAKFAPDGGRVSVRLRRDGAFAEVTVADNGPGMDEQTQRRAFEKFYQGDASHASEGNGLGLPLAKRIVDLHNGTLTATSAPGKGVTFTARVPGAVGERAVF